MASRFLIATLTEPYILTLAPELDPTSIQKVISKSRDFIRGLESSLSISTGRLPPNFSLCQVPVCVDIACKCLNIAQFSREMAIKKSASSAQDYERAFNEAVNLLGVSFPIKFEDLCLMFGCSGIGAACDRLLEKYQQEILKKFEGKSGANFTKPVFKAVAFYLTATHQFKFKVDKKKLIEETRCNSKNFEDVLESMRNTCKLNSNSVEIKMKKKEEEPGTTPEKPNHKRKLDEMQQHVPSPAGASEEGANHQLVIGLDETKITVKKKKENGKSTKSAVTNHGTVRKQTAALLSTSMEASNGPLSNVDDVKNNNNGNRKESNNSKKEVLSGQKQSDSSNTTNPSKSTYNKASKPKQKLLLDFFK